MWEVAAQHQNRQAWKPLRPSTEHLPCDPRPDSGQRTVIACLHPRGRGNRQLRWCVRALCQVVAPSHGLFFSLLQSLPLGGQSTV